MQILAHRGWWLSPEEKNTPEAFSRAFAAGFGIETDLRDHDGQVVIAHDMPKGVLHMSFDAFLKLYKGHGAPGWLALNIKADGLQKLVVEALSAHQITNAFVFDMAVPDALGYLRTPIATYTRQSEFETHPSFYAEAHGVWLDAFRSDWFDAAVIQTHLQNNKSVALVSPELHGRAHEGIWQKWLGLKDERLFLCTDFPDQANALFNKETQS